MKAQSITSIVVAAAMGALACTSLDETSVHAEAAPADPLPSWRDGKAKSALLEFVDKTTAPGSPDLVPIEDRIAVFDNDGTLWPENPIPFEVAFALDTAREMMSRKPELRDHPAYQALAHRDSARLTANHNKLLLELIVATHAGMTGVIAATSDLAREMQS